MEETQPARNSWGLVRDVVGRALAPISSLGWTLLAAGFASWVVAAALDWVEFSYLAIACLLLVAMCGVIGLGRVALSVDLEVEPTRVVAGKSAVGRAVVRNKAARRSLPSQLELPVGEDTLRFGMPSLATGAEHEEVFVIPTTRRGVVPIGPAMSVKGDPLGVIRRELHWTQQLELVVHPITIPLQAAGTGLLRDLEGKQTNEMSNSDLAFHALREYEPGDDLRHVHWRSTAKTGKVVVRQYLDTRRLHLTLAVDSRASSYASEADFETALSAAGSLALASVHSEQETTVLAGEHATAMGSGRQLLDVLARAELGTTSLQVLATRAARIAPGTSVVVLVTGPSTGFTEMRRALAQLPFEARKFCLVVDPSQQVGLSAVRELTVLTMPALADLAALASVAGI